MSHILVVDDEEAVCWALRRAFTGEGHTVEVAATAEEAMALCKKQRPDVVLLDVRLPGMDGISAMAQFRKLTKEAPIIIMTAFGNLSTAVEAVQGGAFEYLTKPFDLNQALELVHQALALGRKPPPSPAVDEEFIRDEIVGRTPAMQAIFKRIALVAPRDDTCVLITGESGTGKELVARAVHRHSPRRDKPFLPIHIASLSPNLVESELFGHVKGAFTGAAESRPGLLQLADGGTVFLDELADIPLPVQVKLLRVLEHNEVLPVGGNQPQPLNIRILSATHRDLSKCVAEGTFRHDLYYRLNVFQIHLPPLRERKDDIPLLAEQFLRRFAPQALPLAQTTVDYLKSLPWFGNVRELQNALEHAAIVARDQAISPEHFPPALAPSSENASGSALASSLRAWIAERIQKSAPEAPSNLYADLLREIEAVLFEDIIRRVEGNRWVAAQWLGLNRATVRKKLALYNLADIDRSHDEEDA